MQRDTQAVYNMRIRKGHPWYIGAGYPAPTRAVGHIGADNTSGISQTTRRLLFRKFTQITKQREWEFARQGSPLPSKALVRNGADIPGLASVSNEQMESSTLEMVNAGLQLSCGPEIALSLGVSWHCGH
jgi:hypothetical protein